MPLFISGSKPPNLNPVKVLLAMIAMMLIGIEAGSNYLLQHVSPTYSRLSAQYHQALGAFPARAGQPTSVLMVGNSLLLDGIEMDRLSAMTSTRMRVYPVFLEATGYYDWLYALRRLFRQGSRPEVVVVGVGVNYFLTEGIRQDYAPKLFFDAADTLPLASDLNLDRTATSNLLLAHVSSYWNTRAAIRTQALGHLIPGLRDLLSQASPPPSTRENRDFETIAIPRLLRLQQLCAANGAKLIVLLPPTLYSGKATNEMEQAGRKAGVDVSVPVDPSGLSPKYFQPDGLHLNSDGAALFTYAVAKDLPKLLGMMHSAPPASRSVDNLSLNARRTVKTESGVPQSNGNF